MRTRLDRPTLRPTLGFALPNPINRVNPVAATRFPFATLTD